MTNFDNIDCIYTIEDLNEKVSKSVCVHYFNEHKIFEYYLDLSLNKDYIDDEMKEHRVIDGWGDAIFLGAGECACTKIELWRIGTDTRMYMHDVYRNEFCHAIKHYILPDKSKTQWQVVRK